MAARKKATASAYDDALRYEVRLTRPVKLYGVPFLPIDTHEMGGADLNLLVAAEGADCVDTAEPR